MEFKHDIMKDLECKNMHFLAWKFICIGTLLNF